MKGDQLGFLETFNLVTTINGRHGSRFRVKKYPAGRQRPSNKSLEISLAFGPTAILQRRWAGHVVVMESRRRLRFSSASQRPVQRMSQRL